LATDVRTLPEWRPTRPWRDWQPERNARLHHFINEQLYPYSPFYRRLFDSNKIDPRSIRTLDDLRRIPFTTKKDVAPTADNATRHLDLVLQPDLAKLRQFAPKSKLLDLAWTKLTAGDAAALRKVRLEYGPVHVIFTTGRTALPTQFVYAPPDFDRLHVVGKRIAEVVGIAPDARTLNVFPFAPHLAFWQSFAVGQASATLALHTGGGKVMGTGGNIIALQRLQPDVIIGVPGYVYHMLRQAQAEGARLEKLTRICLGGERVPLPLRSRLGDLCEQMGRPNVRVQSVLGFTESRQCWAECTPPDHETSYGFHTYPDLEVFECVDPESGEPVAPGERGEIVYSTIVGRGSCVLRYRTGDIAENGIVYDPCPGCGRVVPRVSTNLGRRSDISEFQLTKIRGTLVDMNNFLPAMAAVRDVVEWQLIVRKANDDPDDLDEIDLHIAVRDGVDVDELKQMLTKKLLADTEVAPNLIAVLPLARIESDLGLDTQMKELRIRDLRGAAKAGN
jgi:phenylacetate-CoA ligase